MRDYATISKRLRQYSENCVAYKLDADFANAVTDAADAIEELLAAVQKWISVKERLPEESGYTIIFCADGDRGHVTFGKFLKTPKLWELSGARSYWRVLWWMPLPEPPKGVE